MTSGDEGVTSPDYSIIETEDMGRNVRGEIRRKRHDGRTLKSSICDVLDNSIDAGANEIKVFYDSQIFLGKDSSSLMIIDDGKGIPAEGMRGALMFDTVRESGTYEYWELGSFGVGLKDSCLAHGTELTLFSKQLGSETSVWRLSTGASEFHADSSSDWQLVRDVDMKIRDLPITEWDTEAFQACLHFIGNMERGTIVLLEGMDLENLETEVSHIHAEIKEFISLTFCDYITGIDLGPRVKEEPLKIFFNDPETPLKPLDPFHRSSIGVGELNGQSGTLMQPYNFEIDGMEFCINRYILPYAGKQGETPERIKTAIKAGPEEAQGIYFKRNGRLLDGPWSGSRWRRKAGMGMGTNHHNVARWELILDPKCIDDPTMVPPDKSSVRSNKFHVDIKRAKDERIVWHEEDEIAYGNGKWADLRFGTIYTKRARSRNNRMDIPMICDVDECGNRIAWNEQVCQEHSHGRCPRCHDDLEGGEEYCQSCMEQRCDECEAFLEGSGRLCINCLQEDCVEPGCSQKSTVFGEYCNEHESKVCYVSTCRNISVSEFECCSDHLILPLDTEVKISVSREGSDEEAISIVDGEIVINLDKFGEIRRLSDHIKKQLGE